MPASVGGLPADAPERPADLAAYPAVHDMPPARPVRMLNDDQQVKLEKDLQAARDRQEGHTTTSQKPKPKTTAPQAAGASPNP